MHEVPRGGTAAIFALIGLLVSAPPGWRQKWFGTAMVLLLAGLPGAAHGAQPAAHGSRSGLRPGHLVTGTVKGATGTPVADVLVTAVLRDPRAASTRGRDAAERPYHIVQANLGAATDRNGRYELSLPFADEFYLVALPRQSARAPQRSGYGNTFHPNAARFADAVALQVRPGSRMTADITLIPATLAAVSGTVFDSTGEPATGGRLLIALGDGLFGAGGGALSISPAGRFAIANLQPGTYFLHFREGAWPPPRGTVPLISTAKVVVKGEDIRDVRVVHTKPVRASGRLIIEGQGPDSRPDGIRVSASPTPIDGNPGPAYPGSVNADGTFELRAWPLPSRIRVFVGDREYQVKTVRQNGRELPQGIIDFERLTEAVGLDVVIAGSVVR